MTDTGALRNGPQSLGDVLDNVIAVAEADDDGILHASKVVEAFGAASVLPILIVPAILVVSPLSGIPIFSSICGLTIALIAVQLLLGRTHLWLPGFLARRQIKARRVVGALTRIRPVTDWIDRHTGARLRWIVSRPTNVVFQLACVLAGLTMPFIELVPLSSSLLGSAVCLMALGMLTRDGLIASLALLPIAAAIGVIVFIWF